MVDLIGRVSGLGDCPFCEVEITELENMLFSQKHIIGFFAKLGYTEQEVEIGRIFRKKFRQIELKTCDGQFIFQESNGQIKNMKVICND